MFKNVLLGYYENPNSKRNAILRISTLTFFFFLCYYFLNYIGHTYLAIKVGSVTQSVIHLADGFLYSFIILTNIKYVGLIIINLVFNSPFPEESILFQMMVAILSSLGVTVFYFLMIKITKLPINFTNYTQLTNFIFVASISPFFVYGFTLVFSGLTPSSHISLILDAWMAESLSIVTIVPFMSVIIFPFIDDRLKAYAQDKKVKVKLDYYYLTDIAILFLVQYFVYYSGLASRINLLYLLYIPTIWIASQYGLNRVITLNFSNVLIASFFWKRENPLEIDILEIQVFFLLLSILGLFLGTAVSRRRILEEENINTLKKYNEVQKIEAIGRLANGIAHDFNNLLAIIKLSNDELLLEPESEDKSRLISDINDAILTGKNLIDQILTFSKDTGEKKVVFDASSKINHTCNFLKRLLPGGFQLVLEIEPNLHLEMNPSQFEQIIVNLFVNAKDALELNGEIKISARKVNSIVQIIVQDNGVGISAENLDKIFEPFFTTKQTGTGLGMSTIYGILTQAEGSIQVISNENNGTQVIIELPYSIKPIPITEDLKTKLTSYQSANIMLVEDNNNLRETIEKSLSRLGYTVHSFVSPESALMNYNESYHLVISDVHLPYLSGYEFCTSLHKINPQIRIILISGLFEPSKVNDLSHIKIKFLQKPFDIYALANIIERLISSPNEK
ncbi:MAG: response regulator [Candidatus Heimdallarchaeota archaeon]|nr:response regulator [Candidatus Heimdallarchaeota archaeon]